MRQIRSWIFLWAFFLLLLAAPLAARANTDDSDDDNKTYATGELLVKYKPTLRSTARKYFKAHWGIAAIRQFKNLDIDRVKLPSRMSVDEGLELYRTDPDVEFAEPNYYRYINTTQKFPENFNPPKEDFFKFLWGLHNTGQTVEGISGTDDADIDAPEAWDIRTNCSNIKIAVIDSGVDPAHPELGGQIIAGYDFVDDDNDPMDSRGHGTHVTGTIAASGFNNDGASVAGLCWNAQIIPLRAFDAFGSGTVADIIEAIDEAIAKGAKIINASYGGSNFSLLELEAIVRARDAGILFIASAGNDFKNTDSSPHYPSGYDLDNIIAVAASDQNDNLAFFSNYGPNTIDVAAPGNNIYSAKLDRVKIYNENFDGGSPNWNLQSTWAIASDALTDSPIGNYTNNLNITAVSPEENFSSENGLKLSFQLIGESEVVVNPNTGQITKADFLHVETSDGGGGQWSERSVLIEDFFYFSAGIAGRASNWVDVEVDLGSLDDVQNAYFRFRLETDASNVREGWTIDNISITAADDSYTESSPDYQYLDGTSMAAPHVTGLAALIWSQNTGQTYSQVKEKILQGVERRPSFSAKLLTGGRINAYLSLSGKPASPVNIKAKTKSKTRIDLSWFDGSHGEDGFEIECKEEPAGAFQQIATVGPNTSSYSDTGLTNKTTYTYRVRAFRGGNTSDFSSTVTATAQAVADNDSGGGGGGGGGGGCFIATAAFDSPLHRHVQLLKKFRARYLYTNAVGNLIAQGYNRYSPPIADYVRESHWLKSIVRLMLYPLILWAGFMLSAGPIQIIFCHIGVLLILGLVLRKFIVRLKHQPISATK